MDKLGMYIDCETSGLEPAEGAVLLSVAILLDTGDGTIEFDAVVLPTEEQWVAASPQALSVNGMTWDYLVEHGRSADLVDQELAAWLADNKVGVDTHLHIGHSPDFDKKFLLTLPTVANTGLLQGIGQINVRKMFMQLENMGKVPRGMRRSQHNISLAIGVEPEPDVHTAIEGARVVYRNYWRMRLMGAR